MVAYFPPLHSREEDRKTRAASDISAELVLTGIDARHLTDEIVHP